MFTSRHWGACRQNFGVLIGLFSLECPPKSVVLIRSNILLWFVELYSGQLKHARQRLEFRELLMPVGLAANPVLTYLSNPLRRRPLCVRTEPRPQVCLCC